MSADEALVPRQLYGGAAQLAFPQRFVDLSDFRPIPDHQEVFSDAALDQSLVVEVVEHQTNLRDGDAAAFFFHDQAEHNDAQHSQIDEQRVLQPHDLPHLPPGCFKALVVGQQAVAKGRQGSSALNKVQARTEPTSSWSRGTRAAPPEALRARRHRCCCPAPDAGRPVLRAAAGAR